MSSHDGASSGPSRARTHLTRALLILAVVVVVAACGPEMPAPTNTQNPVLQQPVRISGLDAHDGTIVQDGSTFHLYGTRYNCGFYWDPGHPTPFCGMGAWHATSLTGPWTYDGLLFHPSASNGRGKTWQQTCGDTGWGCFNPRMVRRPSDGTWILWFNAPADFANDHDNAYYAMTCAGPAGPCGPRFEVDTHPCLATVGGCGGPGEWQPSRRVRLVGEVVKPELHVCDEAGDFSIVTDDGGTGWILCTYFDQTLAVERLDSSWMGDRDNVGRERVIVGATESPGAAKVGNGWVFTFADPNCGYCGGTGTSWATKLDGVDSLGLPTTGVLLRGEVSRWSCNGQPRTAFNLADGTAWEWIDDWLGSDHSYAIGARNQTGADVVLAPLKTINGVLQPLACPPGGT